MSRRNRAARRLAALIALSTAGVLALAACTSAPPASENTVAGDGARTSYPLTVENCGEPVVFDEAPDRVMLLETAPVTILEGIGVLDRVIARAGTFSPEYYDAKTNRQIDGIPMLSEEIDASGHLMISAEVVLAQEPDLVLGLPSGVTREGLLDVGANALIQPVYCPTGVEDASFASLYDQILVYGRIFDRNTEAAHLVDSLRERVTAAEELVAGAPERTAAVLYPSVGGGPLYAYGRASMAEPQLEAAGFANVFADVSERVFEVSIEELLGRNPDVLILLYQGDATGVREEVENLPGSESLTALQDDQVLVQLFNFTEPPTPLSVTGLERVIEYFGAGS